MALRSTLPLRIRPTCSACGLANEKLVNPGKPKAGRSGEISDAIISTVDMAVEHPVLAVVRLMGGVGKLRAGNIADIAVCERCDGVEFDSPTVTFCPSCRALREESILLTCPDCQAAFRPPAKRPPFWLTLDQARSRLRLEAAARGWRSRPARSRTPCTPGRSSSCSARLPPMTSRWR